MGCPTLCEIGDDLVFSICTHDAATGVLTDADSSPTYRVYEQEVETPIATGTMAKLDDANTLGFYTERLSITTANGYENGKTYTIYVTATVNSDTGGTAYSFKATVESDPAGSGSDSVTVRWTDDLGAGVADGDVWITSDEAGDTVVAGTLQTDSNGYATFLLDGGATYYMWCQKDGMNSIKGYQFTAVAD